MISAAALGCRIWGRVTCCRRSTFLSLRLPGHTPILPTGTEFALGKKAPFGGVITARHPAGAGLCYAGGAIGIRDGLEATVTDPEMPGRTFKARVARNAVALQALAAQNPDTSRQTVSR